MLNELHASLQTREIRYWRDKQGHEVDFVIARRGPGPTAIDCKWSVKDFDAGNLRVFRRRYPRGDTFLVAHDVDRPSARRIGDFTLRLVGLTDLVEALRRGEGRS